METLIIDNRLYYLPASEGDVQSLITMARQKNLKLRGRGSYHSVPGAVDPDADTDLRYMLSKMNRVTINKSARTVLVEAGCHLGYDPDDPTHTSTQKNGLFIKLDSAGFAVPDMGGITHQTVAGFLSTGASGSNVNHSFGDALISLTFIPADSDNPQPVTVSRHDHDPSRFYAVGVSMGLLGIIVSATFALIERFAITGTEAVTRYEDCEVDISGKGVPGKKSMRDFLLNVKYKRILWYPQPRCTKLVVWQATAYSAKAGIVGPAKRYKITPYHSFPPWLRFLPIQHFAHWIFHAIGSLPRWLRESRRFQRLFYNQIFPVILHVFVCLDKKKSDGTFKSQQFNDYWFSSLPMDNGIDDKQIPVKFSELWIPFSPDSEPDTVAAVMRKLNEIYAKMYADGGPIPGGDFAVELVSAKESDFWMSPSYKTKVFRVDVFWFGVNPGSPADEFYPIFWEALSEFNFRCHWGKFLPPGDGDQGSRYLKPSFPMWESFMELRKQLDPKDIFLTDYWKSHLGI